MAADDANRTSIFELIHPRLTIGTVLLTLGGCTAFLCLHGWLTYRRLLATGAVSGADVLTFVLEDVGLTFAVLGPLLALLVGLGSLRFASPLLRIRRRLQRVQQGDLSGELRLGSRDALREVATDFNRALAGLREALAAERIAIGRAAYAVREVRANLQDPALGAALDRALTQLDRVGERVVLGERVSPEPSPSAAPGAEAEGPRARSRLEAPRQFLEPEERSKFPHPADEAACGEDTEHNLPEAGPHKIGKIVGVDSDTVARAQTSREPLRPPSAAELAQARGEAPPPAEPVDLRQSTDALARSGEETIAGPKPVPGADTIPAPSPSPVTRDVATEAERPAYKAPQQAANGSPGVDAFRSARTVAEPVRAPTREEALRQVEAEMRGG